MLRWSIKKQKLPLKFTWNISREKSDFKTNYIIKLEGQGFTAIGEAAPNNHFNETPRRIEEEFESFLDSSPNKIYETKDLLAILKELKISNALSFAIESAFIHYTALISEQTVEGLLNLVPVNSVETSFSVPMLPPQEVKEFIDYYKLKRFKTLKVKINKINAFELISEVLEGFEGPLRIDANEAFDNPDEVLNLLAKIDTKRIQFLEQPLKASAHDEYLYLKEKSNVFLMADESLVNQNVTQYHQDRFHGVNVKLMKAGGYFKAAKQLRDAKYLGLKTMLGCMVETSVGISSAMHLAHGVDYFDLDGFLFLKKGSDSYHMVYEDGGKIYFKDMH